MTPMKGIDIDARAIAQGMLAMVDDLPDAETYQTALRLGMLPNPLMEVLGKCLKEKAREIIEERIGTRPQGGLGRELWDFCWKESEAWRKEFVSKCAHAVSLEMYRLTPMIV